MTPRCLSTGEHACCTCYGPLVELLSDAAGRIFVWGAVDNRCPNAVWTTAFDGLYRERLHKVGPTFLAMVDR